MVTVAEIRAFTATLPRTEERVVRDRLTFRVGRLVYAALSRDETTLGFGYPKEQRTALVEAEPDRFFLPGAGEMRYHWVCCRLAAIDIDEARELLVDAWTMCAPKKVAAAYHEATAT